MAAPVTAAADADLAIERTPQRGYGRCPASSCSIRKACPAPAASGSTTRATSGSSRRSCASFQIPAAVVATNTGPVVTQYEVKPDAHVKLSRIEALADDLAMALAARSIRIEAPIPGRDVVGIEIPNHNSEVVGFRACYEDAQMTDGDQQAHIRPRPRRQRQGVRRRPGAHAPPADRRRHGLGQERLRQRAHQAAC